MRRGRSAGSIALATVVAGTTLACAGDTMEAPCDLMYGVRWGVETPDIELQLGDTMEIALGTYFHTPRDCTELARSYGDFTLFEARSSDPGAVAVSVADDLTTLEIAALEVADSVLVEVDAITERESREFLVWVELPDEEIGG